MEPINSKSFDYQRLKQEADANKALYDELIKKIREANINAGFQNNNVRIADVARPPLTPVSPNIPRNVLLAFLIATLMGIARHSYWIHLTLRSATRPKLAVFLVRM